jgi:hypothetical protein
MTGPGPADKKPTRATRASTAKATPTKPNDPAADEAWAATEPAAAAVPATEPGAAAGPSDAVSAVAPVQAAAEPQPAAPSAAPPTPPAAPPTPPAAPQAAAAAAQAAPASTGQALPPTVDTGPGAPGAPAATPRVSAPDVAAAVDKAIDRLREQLTLGEIVAGAGALVILIVAWGLFGFLFGHGGTYPPDLVTVGAAALLLILVVQNAAKVDFGPNYRLIVTGLCLMLGFLGVLELLQRIRWVIGGGSFDIGGLTWWMGAVVALVGGWMVWREGRRA